MLRFQYPQYFSAMILIPILIGIFVAMLYWRRKKIREIGNVDTVRQQMLGFIPARQTLKFCLLISALTLLILACANLQKSGEPETVQRKGVDVMIALDVSKSMLATDIQPNRLSKAKQLIGALTEKMSNDRIGLVIFAGKSYLQVPLTIDYSAMKLILQTISPDMVPTQGTVIGEAIKLANKSFSSREKKYKSVILISDGEDHDESAVDAVKKATDEGVIIHTVGIGSPNGSTLIDPSTNAPKLDQQGNPVISKLNEAELKEIANAGHGTYTLLGNTNAAADKLTDALNDMEQRNLGAVLFTNFYSYFPYFIALALLLLIIEWMVPPGNSKRRKTEISIGKTTVCLLLCLTGLLSQAKAQSGKKSIQEGNVLYKEKKYGEARGKYQKALSKDTQLIATSAYNMGNALYRQKQIENARKAYEAAAKKAKDKQEYTGAMYNLGNTYMSEKKWQEAIDVYKEVLRKTPQDNDARYNLAYAQAMLKKDGGGKDKNKDQNKDEQKQDQENKDQKDKQNQQKQDKQDQQNKDEQQQKQPQPSKLSEKQAEQLLNALQQEEKTLQDKKKKQYAAPARMEKDW